MAAVVRRFAAKVAPGEAVYLAPGSIPAWTRYTTPWARPDSARLARVARLASSTGPAFENAPPGSFNPAADPSGLTLDHEGWVEIFGRSAGIQERPGLPSRVTAPDSGWAEGEVARIAGSGKPAVWLVLSYLYGFEFDVLDGPGRPSGPAHLLGADRRHRAGALRALTAAVNQQPLSP